MAASGGGSSDDDEDDNDSSGDDAVIVPAVTNEAPGSPPSVVEGGGADTASTPRGSLSGGRKKFGVFVANLPYSLCEERKLQEIFGGFGQITSVVPTKPKEGRM